MATRELNIVLIGDRASGKTTFVHLLKNIPLQPMRDNKYRATIGSEVHPIIHKKRQMNIWDMGKFSKLENLSHIDVAIFITKMENPIYIPPPTLTAPVIVVNNMGNRMTRTDVNNALTQVLQRIN
jgi:GTPase SAR1 family protein